MNSFELMRRMVATGGDPERVRLLAAEVLSEIRWPAQVGAESLASHDRGVVSKGMDLLASDPGTSMATLAAQPALADPRAETWKVRFLAEQLLLERRRIREALGPLLKQDRPWDESGDARVCDMAYLLERRLARRTAPEGFATRPERERNEWIKKLPKEVE
jgi:hypothetical protein